MAPRTQHYDRGSRAVGMRRIQTRNAYETWFEDQARATGLQCGREMQIEVRGNPPDEQAVKSPISRAPGAGVEGVASDPRSPSFVSRVAEAPRATGAGAAGGGRLVFALDATMSRRPTWRMLPCSLQAEMFDVGGTGGRARRCNWSISAGAWRGAGLALGLGRVGPDGADGRDRLPGRDDADRRGCSSMRSAAAARRRWRRWSMSATPWRRMSTGSCAGRAARGAGHPSVPVPRGSGRGGREAFRGVRG